MTASAPEIAAPEAPVRNVEEYVLSHPERATLEQRVREYEQRRAGRIARLRARSAALSNEAASLRKSADGQLAMIPLGQPILIGHHSEGRDRRFRERMWRKLERSFALDKEAKALAMRAAGAADNDAIFSDDPLAGEKLQDRVALLKQRADLMVAANKCLRKKDDEGLRKLGFTDARIQLLKQPDCFGGIGYPPYKLTNLRANIRRLEQRMQVVAARADDVTTEKQVGAVKVVDNVEDNRLQLFFPGKPSYDMRTLLKKWGFRWSLTNGAWQRHRSNGAVYAAEQVLAKFNAQPPQ